MPDEIWDMRRGLCLPRLAHQSSRISILPQCQSKPVFVEDTKVTVSNTNKKKKTCGAAWYECLLCFLSLCDTHTQNMTDMQRECKTNKHTHTDTHINTILITCSAIYCKSCASEEGGFHFCNMLDQCISAHNLLCSLSICTVTTS